MAEVETFVDVSVVLALLLALVLIGMSVLVGRLGFA